MLLWVSILFRAMVTVVSFLSPGAVEMLSSDAMSSFCCQSLPMYYCKDGCVAAGGEVKEPCPQVIVCMLTFWRKVITDTVAYHCIQHKWFVCLSCELQCHLWHSQILGKAVTGNTWNCLLTLPVYCLHDAWQDHNHHVGSRIMMSLGKTKAVCIAGSLCMAVLVLSP